MRISTSSLLLLLTVAGAPAQALTETTYEAVAVNSLRLAPPTLARLATRHKAELLKGALAPLATEGGAEHLAAPRGVLERRVAEQADRIVKLLSSRTTMEPIVFELGVLSHYVADLNNPLNTATGDPRHEKVRKDFEAYVGRSMKKFILTFDGHRSPELSRQDVGAFARAAADRSARLGPYLSRSYFPDGGQVSSRTFDDRHTAFGIASITYQNAIADCARLYVHIWRQVNGDLRGTPFLGDAPRQAKKQEREGVFRW